MRTFPSAPRAYAVLVALSIVFAGCSRRDQDTTSRAAVEQELATLRAERDQMRVESQQRLAEENRIAARNAEQRRITSELQDAEARRENISRRMTERESTIASLKRTVYERQSALDAYQGEVKKYMMDHKMVLMAIAAGAGGTVAALNPGNKFSKDAEKVGAGFALVAGLYALANAREVSSVIDQLNQASSNVKEIESQIAKFQSLMDSENSALASEQSEMAATEPAVSNLRQQLAALDGGQLPRPVEDAAAQPSWRMPQQPAQTLWSQQPTKARFKWSTANPGQDVTLPNWTTTPKPKWNFSDAK